MQGSHEHDDLILYGFGTFYDGGDREGDRDILFADLIDETVDLELIARAGTDRVDDDTIFQDIGNGTTIGNFERLVVRLGSGDDVALGGDFADLIIGGGGNDILSGGLGDDELDGGGGDDILFYEGGIDEMRGGNGRDIVELGAIEGGYRSIAGALDDNFTNVNGVVERAALGAPEKFRDVLLPLLDGFDGTGIVAFSPFIRIQGEGGVSNITGQFEGTDEVGFFNDDVEIIVISADDEDDILISGAQGGTLSGDGGSDVLISRSGDDVLIGGGEEDHYVFKDNWGSDVIGGEITGTGSLSFFNHDRADVDFFASGDDLIIQQNQTGAEVLFLDYFASGPNGLNYTFAFDDQVSTLDLSTLPGIQVTGAIAPGVTIFGTDGRDDILDATDGADSYFARAGNDLIRGSAGPDIISGGLGLDVVIYENSPVAPDGSGIQISLDFGFGTGGHAEGDILISIEDVLGSAGNDEIGGDDKRNALAGGQGEDVSIRLWRRRFPVGRRGERQRSKAMTVSDLIIFGGSGNDLLLGDAR